MIDPLFNIGDKVDKVFGYRFPGDVRAVFRTTQGNLRYVVELEQYGLLHIFNEEQLQKRNI
jgi:hypothetical protein